jgi:hypothetical protein
MKYGLMEHDIHPQDTLVFLHIPKTGGITLDALIDPMWLPGARCPEYLTYPLARLPRSKIAQYRSFIGHFSFDGLRRLLPPGFQCITMLREPVKRHLSFLRMLKRIGTYASTPSNLPVLFQIGNPHIIQMLQYASQNDNQSTFRRWQDTTLEEMIEDKGLQGNYGLINGQTNLLLPSKHSISNRLISPDSDLRGLGAEELLSETCRNLSSMLFFGLMDRFQDSLFLLAYVFGWQPFPDYLRLNESPNNLQSDSLSESSLATVAEYNDMDLKLYAFAEQEFQRRFDLMTQTLLMRYGRRVHAHLHPPLSTQALFELLENHYRDRFRRRHEKDITSPGQRRFNFDQPIESGLGWHRCETSPVHGSFRWTGPGTTASLDLVRFASGDIELRIGIIGTLIPELLESLLIYVNSVPVGFQRRQEAGEVLILEMVVPRVLVDKEPFLRITFHTGAIGSPHSTDPNNPDPREIGIAVSWIEQSQNNFKDDV